MEPVKPSTAGFWQLLSAIALGLAIVAGTLITSNTIDYVKTFNTSLLTVTGTANQVVTSDEVKWTGGYFATTDLKDLAAGYATMDKDKTVVTAFLEKHGVPAKDITVMPVSMQQNFVNCKYNPKACGASGFTSYRLVQDVRVQSTHVHKIAALAQDTSALVKEGVPFTTGGLPGPVPQGLQYYYDKLPSLRVKLLQEATKDAQNRAEHIASSTDGKVGRLVSLTVEPFQLTPEHSAQVSNSGSYSTTTITKKLTAIVRATFRLPR